jgi:hypothetical protein
MQNIPANTKKRAVLAGKPNRQLFPVVTLSVRLLSSVYCYRNATLVNNHYSFGSGNALVNERVLLSNSTPVDTEFRL